MPGLAAAARVTLAECQEALASFLAPDPYSRSKEHDGRRIEEVDRGWRLLNYERFRNARDEDRSDAACKVVCSKIETHVGGSVVGDVDRNRPTGLNAAAGQFGILGDRR